MNLRSLLQLVASNGQVSGLDCIFVYFGIAFLNVFGKFKFLCKPKITHFIFVLKIARVETINPFGELAVYLALSFAYILCLVKASLFISFDTLVFIL